MRKAPRKYADALRTKVTPEWLEWNEERMVDEDAWEHLVGNGLDPTIYLPENDGKAIPDGGAWILVIDEPLTALQDRFRIPPVSMWRARQHSMSTGGVKLSSGRRIFPQQAVITTPGGDLHLWPHEYVVAKNPMDLVSDPDATLHPLGGKPIIDEDQLFYLQSRGISHSDAVMMLFDKIQSFDFVYVTFPEEITSMLTGVGIPLHRHVAMYPRNEGATR